MHIKKYEDIPTIQLKVWYDRILQLKIVGVKVWCAIHMCANIYIISIHRNVNIYTGTRMREMYITLHISTNPKGRKGTNVHMYDQNVGSLHINSTARARILTYELVGQVEHSKYWKNSGILMAYLFLQRSNLCKYILCTYVCIIFMFRHTKKITPLCLYVRSYIIKFTYSKSYVQIVI